MFVANLLPAVCFGFFCMVYYHSSIDDCAKDGGEELLPRCVAFDLWIFNDSIGIRSKSATRLGKKFLTDIFSVIIYSP